MHIKSIKHQTHTGLLNELRNILDGNKSGNTIYHGEITQVIQTMDFYSDDKGIDRASWIVTYK